VTPSATPTIDSVAIAEGVTLACKAIWSADSIWPAA
jgi:hypothetical protein